MSLAQADVIRLVQHNWRWRCPEDTLTASAFHRLRELTDASHRLAVPARPALRVVETLLNNDHIQNDLRHYLEREFGTKCRDRYWAILEEFFGETGYRDYLGALQRYRAEHPTDVRLLSVSSYDIGAFVASRGRRIRADDRNQVCITGERRARGGYRAGVLCGLAWRQRALPRAGSDLSIHSQETCMNRSRIVRATQRAYGYGCG